jgi:predicted Zn-dependent protease
MKRFVLGALAAAAMTACGVSTQQEIQIGQQNAQQINAQLPIVQDPEINRYLNVLGDSIARLTSRGDLPWQFYMVNSAEVNAFALPGGIIYVNRGLVDKADRMDELAGALGHEIGHVVKRHSVKQMEQMQGAQVGVVLGCTLLGVCNNQAAATAINLGGSAIFAKFSRDDEAQADEVGVANVVRAGIDPRGIPELFQVLIDARSSQPSAVDSWFATHPTEESRIADVNKLIAQISPAVLATLTKDTQAYHAFKNRVAALPAPPPTQGQ